LISHPEERLIAREPFKHGLVETRKNVVYDSSSVDNLPEPLKQYWKTKENNANIEEAEDQAIQFIEDNKSLIEKLVDKVSKLNV